MVQISFNFKPYIMSLLLYQLTSTTVSSYGKKYRRQHGKMLKTKDLILGATLRNAWLTRHVGEPLCPPLGVAGGPDWDGTSKIVSWHWSWQWRGLDLLVPDPHRDQLTWSVVYPPTPALLRYPHSLNDQRSKDLCESCNGQKFKWALI